jgi:hypothetical protein
VKYTKKIVKQYRDQAITIEQIYPKPGIDINKIRLHHVAHWELYHESFYKGYSQSFKAIHDWNEVWIEMINYFIDLALKENSKLIDIRKDTKFMGPIKRGYMQYGGNEAHAIVQVNETNEIFYVHGGW